MMLALFLDITGVTRISVIFMLCVRRVRRDLQRELQRDPQRDLKIDQHNTKETIKWIYGMHDMRDIFEEYREGEKRPTQGP